MASGDSLANAIAKWIFGTGDSHQGRVVREVLIQNLICGVKVSIGGGSKCDGPQHLICIENYRLQNFVSGDLTECLRLDPRVSVLTMVQVLEDNNVTDALHRKDLRHTLEEQTVMAGVQTDNDAHEFLLTREGDHLPDSRVSLN